MHLENDYNAWRNFCWHQHSAALLLLRADTRYLCLTPTEHFIDACTSFHPPREHRSIGAIILFFCIVIQLQLRVARTSCTPLEQGARSIQSEALTGRRVPMRGSERQESREQSDNLVKCSFDPVLLWSSTSYIFWSTILEQKKIKSATPMLLWRNITCTSPKREQKRAKES